MNKTPTPPMEQASFPMPPPNKNADAIGVIGFGTAACEAILDPLAKGDCRKLLVPLEKEEKDAIDVLVDLLMEHPEDIDAATDRFNFNMQEAMRRAKAKIEAGEK